MEPYPTREQAFAKFEEWGEEKVRLRGDTLGPKYKEHMAAWLADQERARSEISGQAGVDAARETSRWTKVQVGVSALGVVVALFVGFLSRPAYDAWRASRHIDAGPTAVDANVAEVETEQPHLGFYRLGESWSGVGRMLPCRPPVPSELPSALADLPLDTMRLCTESSDAYRLLFLGNHLIEIRRDMPRWTIGFRQAWERWSPALFGELGVPDSVQERSESGSGELTSRVGIVAHWSYENGCIKARAIVVPDDLYAVGRVYLWDDGVPAGHC